LPQINTCRDGIASAANLQYPPGQMFVLLEKLGKQIKVFSEHKKSSGTLKFCSRKNVEYIYLKKIKGRGSARDA